MRTLALLLFWASVAWGQSVTYTVSSSWSTGFTGAVVIHGPAAAPVTAWVLEFDLPHGIGSHWDATITPLGNESPILAFSVPDPDAIMASTRAAGVHVAMRFGNKLRISPSVYNNHADVERLIEALP